MVELVGWIMKRSPESGFPPIGDRNPSFVRNQVDVYGSVKRTRGGGDSGDGQGRHTDSCRPGTDVKPKAPSLRRSSQEVD